MFFLQRGFSCWENLITVRFSRYCGQSEHHVRQKLLTLLLRGVTFHRRVSSRMPSFERRDDGVVHVALAADRGRIGKLIGGRANGVQHLALATAFAWRRRYQRQRFEHHGRRHQGAKILQRNLDAGNLAQERVDCCRRGGTHTPEASRYGKHAPVRKTPAQDRNRACVFAALSHPCGRPCRPWPCSTGGKLIAFQA